MKEVSFIKFLESCKEGGIKTLGDLVKAQREQSISGSIAMEKHRLDIERIILELMTAEIESRMRSGQMDISELLLWGEAQRHQIENVLAQEKWLSLARLRNDNNK